MNSEWLIFFQEDDSRCYTARSQLVDKTGNFYHVTQPTYNRNNYFNNTTAKYRDRLLKSLCEKYNVIPLCNVIMPSHTHDLFFCKDFCDIEKLLKSLNTRVAKFIKQERIRDGKNITERIFDTSPAYKRIDNLGYLFFLFKYFYDNPQYLRKNNQFVPYSCFDMWEKGYYKHYQEKLYEKLFSKSLEDICKLCKQLDKKDFHKVASDLYGKVKI